MSASDVSFSTLTIFCRVDSQTECIEHSLLNGTALNPSKHLFRLSSPSVASMISAREMVSYVPAESETAASAPCAPDKIILCESS